jgi:hypothetical protein
MRPLKSGASNWTRQGPVGSLLTLEEFNYTAALTVFGDVIFQTDEYWILIGEER